jgi:5-methyltetrahydrofolate--homocysteine methyltransferase
MRLIRRRREELKVNTTCGASNISFGLPNRHGMNAAFLAMAAGAGMTSAIMNPLHNEEMAAVMGADILMGNDPDCRRWIRKFREPVEGGAEAGAEGGRRRREGGRRRRA